MPLKTSFAGVGAAPELVLEQAANREVADLQHDKLSPVVFGVLQFDARIPETRQGPSGVTAAGIAAPVPSADEVHRLQQIVDGSSIATFVIDQNHVVTHWNKACERLVGIAASEMVGTQGQWRAFYHDQRPVMADLILDDALRKEVTRFYPGKFRKSVLNEAAYEAEDFFPNLGETGRWLYFTAVPLVDRQGRIIGAIETLQDITAQRLAEAALKQSEERYRQLSITDTLTGLFNSRHFYEEVRSEIARAMRHGHPLSLMYVDIDNFKRLNDACGHLEGDRMLESLADLIRRCMRREDSAYRLGGDEFVVLLPETELDSAHLVAERLRAFFAADLPMPSASPTVRCSLSIGVTRYEPWEEFTDFIKRADAATYQAKRQGRNCVVCVAP